MQYFAQRAPDARAQSLFRRLHSEAPLEQWIPESDVWLAVPRTIEGLSTVRTVDYTRTRAQVWSAWRAQRRRERHLRRPRASGT